MTNLDRTIEQLAIALDIHPLEVTVLRVKIKAFAHEELVPDRIVEGLLHILVKAHMAASKEKTNG